VEIRAARTTTARLQALLTGFSVRHPGLRWVRTWGISVTSLVTGLATLFLFRRGVEYFPLFIGYLLILWLTGVVFVGVRQSLANRGARALSVALDYTVQTLLHGLLLFLLPIYYASTTLTSGNVWLLIVLVAATTLTTIDPWYRAVLTRARWAEIALFWVGLFASLNAACPLIGLATEWTLFLSGSLGLLILIPAFGQYLRISWPAVILRVTLSASVLAVCVWWARGWIPPVPLYLTRATFAKAIEQLEPLEPVTRISSEELHAWGRVAAFTAIAAPVGLAEPVYHVWKKNGRTLNQMLLTTVHGGRRGGFRTYSWKTELGSDPAGLWQVDIRTVHGQLIGRVHLLVTAPELNPEILEPPRRQIRQDLQGSES
jgi:Family of unknown function (DUF5924)/Protein of unknown function (DUF2914)